MIVSNKQIIDNFIDKHAHSKSPLNQWLEKIEDAEWENHNQLKSSFSSVDYVGNGRYVFNVGGNNFRLIAIVIFLLVR